MCFTTYNKVLTNVVECSIFTVLPKRWQTEHFDKKLSKHVVEHIKKFAKSLVLLYLCYIRKEIINVFHMNSSPPRYGVCLSVWRGNRHW